MNLHNDPMESQKRGKMAKNILIATKKEYRMLLKAGVDISHIDEVVFLTHKQAEEIYGE